jgi:hypothetical protein
MIRYSSYGGTNRRTPNEGTYLDPLAVQYRELQELRERVKKAEAAEVARHRAKVNSAKQEPVSLKK